jgi:hypothetical protein
MNLHDMLLSSKMRGGSGGSGGVNILGGTEIATSGIVDLTAFSQLSHVICPDADIIGTRAFGNCSALVSIDFPKATKIEPTAFANCVNLVSINAPKATYVSEYVFEGCTSLSKINLPSVEYIYRYAFDDCPSLTTVDLSEIIHINSYAFRDCVNFTTLIIRNIDEVVGFEVTSFQNTPFMSGEGHIYVPSVMYEYYRAGYEAALDQVMPGFFDILFRKIEDYPEICG